MTSHLIDQVPLIDVFRGRTEGVSISLGRINVVSPSLDPSRHNAEMDLGGAELVQFGRHLSSRFDEGLPDLHKLHAVARLGARLVANGENALAHCGMGFNRSALVAISADLSRDER